MLPTASPDRLGNSLISMFWRTPAASLGEQARRRVSLHLIPFLFFLYILAFLDRVNVSVAGLSMKKSLAEGGMAFDDATLGFGAGIFFWGYWILEIPSTLSVGRFGARWVFARILVLWGLCAALQGTIGTHFASSLFSWLPAINEQASWFTSADTRIDFLLGWAVRLFRHDAHLAIFARSAAFVNGLHDTPAYQYFFFRFLLGFFEGGFFPSVIVYLSLWFRQQDRGRAVASFMAAIPLSTMLGLPLSALLLDVNWLGVQGWRWIFIIQGLLPVLAGFATLFLLPDRPARAAWLAAEEKTWLLAELAEEEKAKRTRPREPLAHHLGVVLLLTAVYFCLNLTMYGLSMFMPAIIKSQSGLGDRGASLLAALPYLMAFLGMLANGWHSDRRRERIWHTALPLALTGVGILLACFLDGRQAWPVLIMIFIVGTALHAPYPTFWPLPTMFMGATAAAAAIGFINMIGNLGGSVGPWLVGVAKTGETSFAPALLRIAPWPMIGAVILVALGYWRKKVVRSP
jgi:sugar phosphate permease